MKRNLIMAAALALLIGGAGATALSSAGTAMPLSAARSSGVETGQPSELLTQVQERRRWRRGNRFNRGWRNNRGWNRGWRYNRFAHGPRYRYRHGGFRHYNNGWWYASPFWFGAIAAAPYYYARPRAYYGGGHVEWCLNRYNSYNPRTDSFLGYDGYYRRCNSPYT